MKFNFKYKRLLTLIIAVMMLASAMPVGLLAEDARTVRVDHSDIASDKAIYVNNLTPALIARPEEGTTADFLKEPALPAIYTLRTDFKAEKGEKYSVNYQPYVASVGAAAKPDEQAKINKEIKLPDMAGYMTPKGEEEIIEDSKTIQVFKNSYDAIVKAATNGHQTGDKEKGYKYLALKEYKYAATTSKITVKHVFQDMDDFNKFTNKDGTITKNDGTVIAKDGTETKYDLNDHDQKEKYQEFVRDHENLRILQGNTGSTLEVQALQESERPGFVPQVEKLKTQVPEDTTDFKIEYRYNRAHYDVVFDTQDGTALPARTYYYDQEIPKIDENSIPTKIGSEFLGWKPSHDLYGADGTKYKKNEIIKDSKNNAIVDLGNIYYKKGINGKIEYQNGDPVKQTIANEIKLKMPALKLGNGKEIPREKLKFTAVWKDKEKADFAIQFWAEKADHPDNAPLLDKYEYMSTKVYKDIDVGFRPYLQDIPVKGVQFPDLDQKRLEKIWNGEKFYADKYLYLNKFFVYNKKLTDEQNKDPNKPNEAKEVSSTGQTVYNIYFDRQVYDLYFTKSNVQPAENTFYPEIYVPDGNGGAKLAGGPGNPYHFSARFNQLMLGWPNDAMQTKGFDEGKQSYGWGPNYGVPNWPLHLDTPPYRLNADEFLDMSNYDNWGGYVSKIDKGDGTYIDVYKDPRYKDAPYKALSFGIKQDKGSMPHHMDFWMDGFKDGETIIRYDLYRSKADTNSLTYGHKYSKVQGFTAYGSTIEEGSEENGRITEDDIDALNDERGEITPYPDKDYTDIFGFNNALGQMHFRAAFFNNADEFGDALDGNSFKENGYIRFKYKRNKYPLRFNYDPSKIKDDSEFGSTNSLDTFYEFPLKVLSPDLVPELTEEQKEKGEKKEYFKENPANLLDNPKNLQTLGLTDLVFTDTDGKLKVKRPEGLSDQMVFKGWALDPAGNKMVWQYPKSKMPSHAVNLYAIWDEPDYKWKVTVDPNGGTLNAINPNSLTTKMKTIKEGDIGQEEEKTYPVVGYKGEKAKEGTQVFTVVQRQKLKELPKPTRYGYDFLGWEVIRYKKDGENYTNEQDTSYRDKYRVPELYSFGTDVVAPIYLKAIWVENKRAEVKVYHYFLKRDSNDKFVLCDEKYPNPEPNSLSYKRVDDYVPATGEKQDEHWILANNAELMEKLSGKWTEQIKDDQGNVIETKEHELLPEYEAYNNRVKLNNTYFQTFRVQDNINVGTEQNPIYEPNPENVFRFYYRPFRTREYKVNYIDERGKKEVEDFFKGLDLTDITGLKGDELLEANESNKAKFKAKRADLEKILNDNKVINKEEVTSECRHYDARNYRHIPGWKLVSKPQQQLFYDVNEDTNEFLGINGTGSNEIYFYYKDARVIEVKNPKDPAPEGYVRVTFKIDDEHKGGVFKDKDGKEATELYYDVIKGLKSNNLPHPIIWEGGKDDQGNDKKKEENRYYITPDQGKKFIKWDNEKWLNKETEINKNYTFTAYFEWSGLSAKSEGLVRTEAFKDPNGKWTNDFAPKLADLKAQLVWKEIENGKEVVKDLPTNVTIKFFNKDANGIEKEIETDEDIFELVKEMGKDDAKETVRTVNIIAKATFEEGKNTQELNIPITVYKNRYEALNREWQKPKYLSDAESKDAKDGGLKDILKDTDTKAYVKVTVSPSGDMKAKDNKVYYVNPKAWVEIPEVKSEGSSTFINWTADKINQNEDGKDNGKFDFAKRHKFTEDTVIKPVDAKDVVEQEKGKDKPDVPETYVKVIVKTTDKATDETAFEKTFWVNPEKEVAIDVTNPTGKTNQEAELKDGNGKPIGKQKVDYIYKGWQIVKTGETDDDLTDLTKPKEIKLEKQQYTDKVTVVEAIYKNEIKYVDIVEPLKTKKLDTPQGKEITDNDLIKQITPQAGKEIASIEVISKPDGNTVGDTPAKVIVKYKDGTTQGTNDNPIVIPVEVHDNIIPAGPNGEKPEKALTNYVKITFKAGEGGKFENTLKNEFIYYVSPEVEVDLTETAGKIDKTPNVGYISGNWDTSETKKLKDTFKTETEFTFNFTKNANVVEANPDNPNQVIPKGYVKVTFKTDGHGKVNGKDIVVYYVDPNAGIKLKVLGENETATEKQLEVPKATPNPNYTFNNVWQEPIDETTPITSDRTHVAIFEDGKVKLTYDKGGDDVTGTVPDEVTVNVGTKVRLANADGLSKDNATFAGWKIGNDTYKAGQEITLNENTTAIAEWSAAKHTVKFNSMGGSDVSSQTVEHGKTATNPEAPKLDGKVFMGWKENASDTDYFDFTTPITADKTLIAIWEKPVQKIEDGTTVEKQFIKVTFNKGNHGTLKLDEQNTELENVNYKVAKNYTMTEAMDSGLVVPKAIANTYYKVTGTNKGWDKELELKGEDITFTAQYEIKDDVVPVDINNKTPEEIQKLRDNKPEGTVVVEFAIEGNTGNDKALLGGNTFFYVKKNTDVSIKSPSVLTVGNKYIFDTWKNVTVDGEYIKGKFTEDTVITDQDTKITGMNLEIPVAGLTRVTVLDIPDGETGNLVVIRDGQRYPFEMTTYRRRRKEYKIFDVSSLPGGCIKSGDMIIYWTEKGNIKSSEYTEVIK